MGKIKSIFKETQVSRSLNPEKKCLTIEKLKSWEGFTNLTDNEAKEIVDSIIILADILVKIVQTEQSYNVSSETPIIELNPHKSKAA